MDAPPPADGRLRRSRSPAPAVAEARVAARTESGQAFVLGALFLGLLSIFILVVPGLAIGYALRAGAASAADAAALACAEQGTILRDQDARGDVYQESVAVDAVAGPQAGAVTWINNLGHLPLQTVSFAAVPSGADCTVTAVVQATLPILALLGHGRRTYRWTARAEAKAYVTPP